MKRVHPVSVRWIDSTMNGHWHAASAVGAALDPTATIASVGYLLEKTRKHIVLAQSLSEGSQEVGNLLSIPRFAVVSIKRL